MRRSLAFVGSLGFILAAVFLVNERFPELMPGRLKSALASETVTGFVTHVRDSDTIEVVGRPIRFGSLDCPELATADGKRAKDVVRSISFGRTLTCHLGWRTSYDRTIGNCSLEDGSDLASQMIQNGFCKRYIW